MNDVQKATSQKSLCVRPRAAVQHVQLNAAIRRCAQMEKGINAALAILKSLPSESAAVEIGDILLTALGE
jgi:hypothetical protein